VDDEGSTDPVGRTAGERRMEVNMEETNSNDGMGPLEEWIIYNQNDCFSHSSSGDEQANQ